jgi:hypothetical protein
MPWVATAVAAAHRGPACREPLKALAADAAGGAAARGPAPPTRRRCAGAHHSFSSNRTPPQHTARSYVGSRSLPSRDGDMDGTRRGSQRKNEMVHQATDGVEYVIGT